MKLINWLFVMCGLVIAAAGCGGGGGGGATGGSSGTVPTGNPSVVAKVSAPAPLAQCPNGGITVDTGIDSNQNGLLDPGEVALTQYVCNGANGTNGNNGISALVNIASEPTGTNCANGGNKVSVGPDSNANDVLDFSEITSTKYICNGVNGSNGANSLLSITTESVGNNCATGGLKVLSWLDTTANGTVDIGETSFTNYICNSPGTVVIQSISADPSVVRPSADTSLKVSATDGVGSPLTYQWSGSGSLSLATSATTTWTAPSTVGSYLLSVVVSNGSSTVTGYASILVSAAPAGPIVTSVAPQSAKAGDEVVIAGAGFGPSQSTSTVTIGGVTVSTVNSWSENQIKAIVPTGAKTGSVVVNVGSVDSSPGYISVPWSEGVVTATGDQNSPVIISDGDGGAIIAWTDNRSGTAVYAQRVNRAGLPIWAANGVLISANGVYPTLVADGSGGAVISWVQADTNIYVQRLNRLGQAMWTAAGVPLTTTSNQQASHQMIADGSGGAIIAWQDTRTPGNGSDIYAQHVNGAGMMLWTAGGVPICATYGRQQNLQITTDGAGGAIIAWRDDRVYAYDIYAQAVNNGGVAQWTANGVPISTLPNNKEAPNLISDGSGGAIIAWKQDTGTGIDWRTYAQRVNSAGIAQWASGTGVLISTSSTDQQTPQIITDSAAGAIIAWTDFRHGAYDGDIYAQRVDSGGGKLWASNGVAVCTDSSGSQDTPSMAPDGFGGAFIVWQDMRTGASYNAYAQRISRSGTSYWTTNGVAISTAGYVISPQLVSDGSDGAIIVWEDFRNDGNSDIYGQSLGYDGSL